MTIYGSDFYVADLRAWLKTAKYNEPIFIETTDKKQVSLVRARIIDWSSGNDWVFTTRALEGGLLVINHGCLYKQKPIT